MKLFKLNKQNFFHWMDSRLNTMVQGPSSCCTTRHTIYRQLMLCLSAMIAQCVKCSVGLQTRLYWLQKGWARWKFWCSDKLWDSSSMCHIVCQYLFRLFCLNLKMKRFRCDREGSKKDSGRQKLYLVWAASALSPTLLTTGQPPRPTILYMYWTSGWLNASVIQVYRTWLYTQDLSGISKTMSWQQSAMC